MERSTSLPMSMVQIKKRIRQQQKNQKQNSGGRVQHCRKLISPLKGKQKEKATGVTEVSTMSKFPKAYSLTGAQIPAAKPQLQRRQLTPACKCTEVNWIYKCKADKYDRLKQFQRVKLWSNSALFISSVCQQNAKLFLKFRKFSDNKLKTDVLNPYPVNRSLYLPSNQPILCRMSSSYLLLDCLLTNSFYLSERETSSAH